MVSRARGTTPLRGRPIWNRAICILLQGPPTGHRTAFSRLSRAHAARGSRSMQPRARRAPCWHGCLPGSSEDPAHGPNPMGNPKMPETPPKDDTHGRADSVVARRQSCARGGHRNQHPPPLAGRLSRRRARGSRTVLTPAGLGTAHACARHGNCGCCWLPGHGRHWCRTLRPVKP